MSTTSPAARTPGLLERFFQVEQRGSTWRTEVLAGLTTFLTMAYIVFVNPEILSQTGMPVEAVAAATCVSAAIGCILMGFLANYPIALAPGMGLNAYFAFTVVKEMGVPWQTALGCVFISGCVFLLLTAAGVRQLIVNAIPRELFSAVAAGVGLFVAFVGLRDAGIIVPNGATMVAMGNIRAPQTALACVGLLLIAVLQAWRIRTAMLLGIVGYYAGRLCAGHCEVATSALSVSGYDRHCVPPRYSRRIPHGRVVRCRLAGNCVCVFVCGSIR